MNGRDFVYDVEIEPIGHLTKRDSVAEALRREILSAGLRPGTPLRQQDIAARLGVSPTPVREAFRLLEAEGYISSRAHRGVIVAERNYDDTLDAYEIRLALESVAVRRLVASADPEVMGELRRLTARAPRAIRAGDTDEFRHASVSFHERLTAAAGSALLRQFTDRLAAYWFFFPQDPRRMAEAHGDHIAVIDAIEAHDAEGAIRVLRRHLQSNIALLRQIRDKAEGGHAQATPRKRAASKRPAAKVSRTPRR